jgi:hypothetical protein
MIQVDAVVNHGDLAAVTIEIRGDLLGPTGAHSDDAGGTAISRVNHAPREPVHGMALGEGAGREQMIGPQVRYIEDVRAAFDEREQHAGDTRKDGLGFDEHDVGPGNAQAEQHSAAHERDLAQQLATDPRAGRGFEPGLNHPDSVQIGHDHGLAVIAAVDQTLRIMRKTGEDGNLVTPLLQFPG